MYLSILVIVSVSLAAVPAEAGTWLGEAGSEQSPRDLATKLQELIDQGARQSTEVEGLSPHVTFPGTSMASPGSPRIVPAAKRRPGGMVRTTRQQHTPLNAKRPHRPLTGQGWRREMHGGGLPKPITAGVKKSYQGAKKGLRKVGDGFVAGARGTKNFGKKIKTDIKNGYTAHVQPVIGPPAAAAKRNWNKFTTAVGNSPPGRAADYFKNHGIFGSAVKRSNRNDRPNEPKDHGPVHKFLALGGNGLAKTAGLGVKGIKFTGKKAAAGIKTMGEGAAKKWGGFKDGSKAFGTKVAGTNAFQTMKGGAQALKTKYNNSTFNRGVQYTKAHGLLGAFRAKTVGKGYPPKEPNFGLPKPPGNPYVKSAYDTGSRITLNTPLSSKEHLSPPASNHSNSSTSSFSQDSKGLPKHAYITGGKVTYKRPSSYESSPESTPNNQSTTSVDNTGSNGSSSKYGGVGGGK